MNPFELIFVAFDLFRKWKISQNEFIFQINKSKLNEFSIIALIIKSILKLYSWWNEDFYFQVFLWQQVYARSFKFGRYCERIPRKCSFWLPHHELHFFFTKSLLKTMLTFQFSEIFQITLNQNNPIDWQNSLNFIYFQIRFFQVFWVASQIFYFFNCERRNFWLKLLACSYLPSENKNQHFIINFNEI
jgi:hypothetical protein